MSNLNTTLSGAHGDLAVVKRLAWRGAIWVTLTSAVAVPLAYYRNWILGRIGETGEVVGTYAIILLFFQIVVTFVLFGGVSVVTNFVPKIHQAEDKAGFLTAYALISMGAVTVFVALMYLFPGLVSFLIQTPVDAPIQRVLSVLAPLIVLSQIVVFALAGLMAFRMSALLSQVQIFFVCTLATVGYFLFPEYLHERAVVILGATVGMANLFIVLIGAVRVFRALPGLGRRLHLPSGFWRFSAFVHLNTTSTFAYNSIDQLFVLAALGRPELGAYFVLLQCAQLTTFVPQRIGQVMLASFSHLVGSERHDELRRAYTRLCRIILLLSTPLALIMVLFSYPIALMFGAWYAERHLYLLLLALVSHVGSLGSVNSMLILAKARTGLFLVNSIVQICLQLGITVFLLGRFGVFAVIAGKAAGIVAAQIGLFAIVRGKLDKVHLAPPAEFWIALLLVLGAGVLAWKLAPLPVLWAATAFIGFTAGFLFLIRFRPQEIIALVERRGC